MVEISDVEVNKESKYKRIVYDDDKPVIEQPSQDSQEESER